jgi:hypothetical protein
MVVDEASGRGTGTRAIGASAVGVETAPGAPTNSGRADSMGVARAGLELRFVGMRNWREKLAANWGGGKTPEDRCFL